MGDTYHHPKNHKPLREGTDLTVPKFAEHARHIIGVSTSNNGYGFPALAMEPIARSDPRPLGGMLGILVQVGKEYRIAPDLIRGGSRKAYIARAKQDFMWRARQVKWEDGSHRYTTPQIARFLNLQDHTTVLHGIQKHEERMAAEVQAA